MTKFAFYGRVSTEDQQDPASSKQWQLARAIRGARAMARSRSIGADHGRHRRSRRRGGTASGE